MGSTAELGEGGGADPVNQLDQELQRIMRLEPIKRLAKEYGLKDPCKGDNRFTPWAWTGQPFPLGMFMHIAVTKPKLFCTLLAAGVVRPKKPRRAQIARRSASCAAHKINS